MSYRFATLVMVLLCSPGIAAAIDEEKQLATQTEGAADVAPSTDLQVPDAPGSGEPAGVVTLRVLAASVVLNAAASHTVEAGAPADTPHGSLAEGLARDLSQPPAGERSASWSDRARELLDAKARDAAIELFFQVRVAATENTPASLQIGRRLPRVTSTTMSQRGTMNAVTYENFGAVLEAIPRVESDGRILVAIQLESSGPGAEEEGTPLAVAGEGQQIRAGTTETATLKTTVRAAPGETLVVADQCYHRAGKLVEFFVLLEAELAAAQ